MLISLQWLNLSLDAGPGSTPIAAAEADELLTHLGFPIEETTVLPNGDTVIDVEVTSNRGDVLSHVGCAREIAASDAKSQPWALKPAGFDLPAATAGPVADALTLENREPGVCPLFTARVVKGVKVGPSPKWLVDALEAIGQRSINNLVDITNFITFELGNPCHVFDLNKLDGKSLIIRYAGEGETLTTLDGKARVLKATDLVVADASRPRSLAGVIGGQDSEVDESTTDVVFEMATWDPVTIRTAARRLAIRTDAAYRFERGVDPRTIADAADRAVAMILELAGGTLCEGVLSEGSEPTNTEPIHLSVDRVCATLGLNLPADQIKRRLEALEIIVTDDGEGTLSCVPPPFRLDLLRPIDLIEEVARTVGYDQIPMSEKLPIRVRPPQERERARREIASVLTGMGFYETVTFSFATPDRAAMFLPSDLEVVGVDDERRGAEPILRPSVVPSLLACRRTNAAAGATSTGGVRLFERSAIFAQTKDGTSAERTTYAMLVDVPGVTPGKNPKRDQLQEGFRLMRGAVETLARAMGGAGASIEIQAADPDRPAFAAGAFATVALGGEHLGLIAVPTAEALKAFDLDVPVVVAELDAGVLEGLFPPKAIVEAPPSFPAIERDLSLIVQDGLAWGDVRSLVAKLNEAGKLDHFAGCEFVAVYRGAQIGANRKSLTARLRFQSPERTLKHAEVDPQIERVVASAASEFGAELRE